jgi:PEGA domain
MHYRVRKILFLIFFSIFLAGAPLLVLYTAGYRLNFTTFHVQQTGVIALSSTPRGATVLLNGVDTGAKTPYVIQRLSPGSYTIGLAKDGYRSWEQRVDVSSGATTYITATLFADTLPELLLETAAIDAVGDESGRFIDLLLPFDEETETQSVSRYDTVTHVSRTLATLERTENSSYTSLSHNIDETVLLLAQNDEVTGIDVATGTLLDTDAFALATNPLPGYTFTDNGTNTEFRETQTNALITLLPPGSYTVTFTDDQRTMFVDSRGRTYLFTPSTNTVTQIAFPSALVDENSDESLFIGSDGNEIDIFDPATGSTTLLTRQSEPIIGLNWHTDDQSVLCATPEHIFAVAREKHETRETTILVSEATILGMWPDTTGKHLTFFGTVNEISGIWSLALTQ